MTSSPTPYGVDGTKANYYEISLFLNKILLPDYLHNLEYPPDAQKDSSTRYTFALNTITDYAANCISSALGRPLNAKEVEFIRDRVEAFMKTTKAKQ